MTQDIHTFLATLSAGSVPTWITAALLAVMAWRGVPGVLDAIARGFELLANRQSAIEARLMAMLTQRDEQHRADITDLREQHAQCIARDQAKDDRIVVLEAKVRELKDENAGLKRMFGQMQESTVAVLPGSMVSENIQRAAASSAQHRKDKQP